MAQKIVEIDIKLKDIRNSQVQLRKRFADLDSEAKYLKQPRDFAEKEV